MKNATLTFTAIATLCLATVASAQTISQVGGETNSGTMPGSPSDYIIFDGSNYNVGTEPSDAYTNLPDFEIVGGEAQSAGDSGFSSIKPPGSLTALPTGGILSPNTIAVGLELGTINANGLSSTGFNYNDFFIYVMVDNAPGDSFYEDTTVDLDARLDGVEMTLIPASITSYNSSLTSADYVEYRVEGLGTAVAADRAAAGDGDMVLRVFKANGQGAILGGISFESIPEPSTWAMMFIGAAALFVIARRAKSTAR
jgi:hypothetical protein